LAGVTSPIADLLLSTAPNHAADLELFGRFAGPWIFDGTDFGYVLGGRAIQDVRYCEGVEHGTTIRIPRGDGTWDVVYITPVHRAVRHLHGGPEGERIVLTGVSGDRHLRWSFNDITPDAFVWRGEQSTDGGATFRLAEEMRLTRP
jgi:hypothetical protein